ncbi:MAG: DNA-3-methyladenine glycosylase I [Miltoncostaeaceae bacterium]
MSELPEGLLRGEDGRARCWWAGSAPEYVAYHDQEWGRPVEGDVALFERLSLESFQSGLSWLTILRKREGFRAAFEGFDPERVAAYGVRDLDRLLGDAAIVRHRGKIEATIANAGTLLSIWAGGETLGEILASHAPAAAHRPAALDHDALMRLAKTAQSTALSKDLKLRGWRFLGPTTAYAAMQAVGIVNDHLEGCFVRPTLMGRGDLPIP